MQMSTAIIAAAVLLWSSIGSAQVSTTPAPLGPALPIGKPFETLDQLTELYNGGRWDDLLKLARSLLDDTAAAARRAKQDKPSADAVSSAVDYKKNYIILTWIGADPFGKIMLARIVVHEPSPEPFWPDLPGVGVGADEAHTYEVFLSRGVRGKLTSVYASSRDKDPQ